MDKSTCRYQKSGGTTESFAIPQGDTVAGQEREQRGFQRPAVAVLTDKEDSRPADQGEPEGQIDLPLGFLACEELRLLEDGSSVFSAAHKPA